MQIRLQSAQPGFRSSKGQGWAGIARGPCGKSCAKTAEKDGPENPSQPKIGSGKKAHTLLNRFSKSIYFPLANNRKLR